MVLQEVVLMTLMTQDSSLELLVIQYCNLALGDTLMMEVLLFQRDVKEGMDPKVSMTYMQG